jgi:hypothetical protein
VSLFFVITIPVMMSLRFLKLVLGLYFGCEVYYGNGRCCSVAEWFMTLRRQNITLERPFQYVILISAFEVSDVNVYIPGVKFSNMLINQKSEHIRSDVLRWLC